MNIRDGDSSSVLEMCQTFRAMVRLVNEFPKFFYNFIYGFQSLKEELGFRIQIVSGIPDSLICIWDSTEAMIPGSTSKIFSDFGFDEQKFL